MRARNQFARRLGFGLGMAMLALFTAGCIDDFDKVGDGQFGSGPSCASLCEKAAECDGSQGVADCRNQCEEIERIVERADCEDDFRDFLNCASEVPDICRVSDDQCAAEVQVYGECVTLYCERYPDDCGVIYD
jgi:hypothetical protein